MRRCVLLLTVMLIVCLGVWVNAGPQESSWPEVEKAINEGLPKTAVERLAPIIEDAMAKKKYAEAIKAISMKIVLEANIQGNQPAEKVRRMQAEIAKAPAEMKPVMHAVLANWLWHYFQQNRWRFMQRTQTSEPPTDDFETWDLPRILAEIDRQFQRALESHDLLKSIPVSQYDALLEKGNAPDSYRPTLYDVIAHNALEFYQAGEQAATASEDEFEVLAESPIFADIDAFLSWNPETTDEDSLTLRAVRLYQDVLQFHRDDSEPSARLDTDLLRLNYGNQVAVGDEKRTRYKEALRRFIDRNPNHEISARALHHLATEIYAEGDFVEARKLALQGLNRFPNSVGGRRCFNLIQQIEARSAQLSTERVWNDPRPSIQVRYRNIDRVFFRLVAFDFREFVTSQRWQPENLNWEQRRALLSKRPIRSWSETLPPTPDYRERVHAVTAPDDVPPGSYYLIASHRPDFQEKDNQVTFTEIWESRLAIVLRNHVGQGTIDGFVLDATSGEPMRQARVRVWERGPDNRWLEKPAKVTDRNGMFRIQDSERRPILVLANHQGQRLASGHQIQPYRSPPSSPSEQTTFFTDRSLYRPGQTIHYKGISFRVNTEKDNYQTLARRSISVVLLDVNGQEVERRQHVTNRFGSFSGSVTAPRDRVTGHMTLRVEGGPIGQTGVSVEEYKRPKFRVELQSPTEPARLDQTVTLTGAAKAYTGAPIDQAKVQWRVVREVQYPVWWYWRCWWMPPISDAGQEIAHGRARTDVNGNFEIEFPAKPDRSAPRESEPTFRYTVYADVTDAAGETRSDQIQVNVGYTALSASLSAARWLVDEDPVKIDIRTTTLDGIGQSAKGKLRIYQVQQPDEVARSPLGGAPTPYDPDDRPAVDPANPNSWPDGEMVRELEFETNAGGAAQISVSLPAGMFRATLETADEFGQQVSALLPLQVLDPDADRLKSKLTHLFASPQRPWSPGETYQAIWGTGYESGRAFVEVMHRGRALQSFWTDGRKTQIRIEQAIDESMRGGFVVRTTMVRENRAYFDQEVVQVPWTNKQLQIRWEHFVSKLKPGQQERWTALITGPDAKQAAAEMVAGMYDASLDAFSPHQWPTAFDVFRRERLQVQSQFENHLKTLQQIFHDWRIETRDGSLIYRHFPSQIVQNFWGFQHPSAMTMRGLRASPAEFMDAGGMEADAMKSDMMSLAFEGGEQARSRQQNVRGDDAAPSVPPSGPDLDVVSIRKDLSETAFFFPHLVSDSEGRVVMEFTMPEALTQWKFQGFAHDQSLRSSYITSQVISAKDLMVQPNAPRFLREGDLVEFTVKISNQSPTGQSGVARLSFQDAISGDQVDQIFNEDPKEKPFDIPAGQSVTLSWRLNVPDDLGVLIYKAVASTGRLSDGEEGYVPVLSRRVLVTESLPLPIRGPQIREFEFQKLLRSADSDSIRHQALTVQMVSNPSWYAVLALPYLMEYPYQCAEQRFNRLYANALARHIVSSDPKIARVFQQWRGTETLDSPLEKNEDLRSVLIEETPWVRQAVSESQARRNVAVLFDTNRIAEETRRGLFELAQMQLADGAWPWFPGGRANDYITLYITTGFGRLRHLGVELDIAPALKSLQRLDRWVTRLYEQIDRGDRDKNHLSTTIALYLYGRSFFLSDVPIADEHRGAVDYWLQQGKTYWLQLDHRQSQAHLALALKRFGDPVVASAIMRSIKERSVHDDELGMFWRDTELSWWWYRAPIETQAIMIEAFDEVVGDRDAVEACKVWLLKQKQTQDWKTTKATADAVYALLLRGADQLASDLIVEVELGGKQVRPDKTEAGTGFYEYRFVRGEIDPAFGRVRVKKQDDGVAWGSLHWQYLEDLGKVTPHSETPLTLTKQLYVKRHTSKGPTLHRVTEPVNVGDELVVRIVLRTDRDMEYVHLKDQRASGTEPLNVLSHYRYQDGLAYYESTRDTASHFFIDYLPKGTYVFEYSTRVQLRGTYQSGIASIQCMYAPEFNSHSESLTIEVQ